MGKYLLLLACLIIPGIWGCLVAWAFTKFWPKRWMKGPLVVEEKKITKGPPEVWDYQI